MKKKEIALKAIEILKDRYPEEICSLRYTDPFQLLVAVRLAAQCTDARVNQIMPALFERFPTLHHFAEAQPEEVEPYIYSTGFYRAKARDLVAMARMLRDQYDGVIPNTIEELIKLPGVGRKTANLICGDVYNVPGVVVADTHLIRIANRLGLVNSKDPVKVEMALRKLLPPEESNNFCHRMVLFGRDICVARKPKCPLCPMNDFCPKKLTK